MVDETFMFRPPFPLYKHFGGVSGGVLLSHTLSGAVPSALVGLASGFGMGPGVSRTAMATVTHHQKTLVVSSVLNTRGRENISVDVVGKNDKGQALGLLVTVSYTHYCASTSVLSTRWSTGSLTNLCCESPHLEACFPLRCFQRLSVPNVANQPCTWRYNWHTRGWSVPVLSY